jgi:cathepsin D
MRFLSGLSILVALSGHEIDARKVPLGRHKRDPLAKSRQISADLAKEIAVKANAAQNETLPNSDTMTSVDAVYYIGPVVVGGQTFQVIYDTGSNLLWVPSRNCGASCAPHETYSGPYTPVNQNFKLTYGSGSASGSFVKAPVTLADASLSSFKMGLANNVEFSGYQSSQYDGLLGLAWPGLNGDQNVASLVPSLYQAGQIPANLFTMYLAADGSGGELSLGEIDESRYQGNMTWLPLVLQEWWTVALTGLMVGDNAKVVSTSSLGSQTAIIDSGTSLIVGPDDQIMNLMDTIQTVSGVPVYYDSSSDLYAIYCSDVDSLPVITFTLMGSDKQQYHFTMPGATYVITSLTNNPRVCVLSFQKSGSMSSGTVDWILGDPFLRTYYSVYDYQNARVGLAAAYPSAGSVIPGDKSSLSQSVSVVFLVVVLTVMSM